MNGPLASIATLLRLAWRIDRPRLLKALGLLLAGGLATPLIALGLKEFTEAALDGRVGHAVVTALVLSVLLVFELTLGHFAHLSYFELGEQQEMALHRELLDLSNGTHGIAHFDRPEYASTVTLVREELHLIRGWTEASLQLTVLVAQLAFSASLLAWVNPWLVLLPAAAVPPVVLGGRAQRLAEAAKERVAAQTQLSRHLVELSTTSASVKELRLFHAEDLILERQRDAWDTVTRTQGAAQLRAAGLRAAGHGLFALAHTAALLLVVRQAAAGSAGVGDVVLVVALAVNVSAQVATGLGLLTTLQKGARTLDRIDSLREWSVRSVPDGTGPVPVRLERGLRLENVGFTYPGTGREVLRGVSVDIPAGRTVAVVGENGAGKSTLVKLLCGLYEPTDGRILVDGADLGSLSADAWRERTAALFQDFARMELLLRENVGVGSTAELHSDEAVTAALRASRAEALVAKVPGGLDGLLGRAYGDGAELSGGQWQSLGLARTLMRTDPLLVVLDEPASALDAAAEHALFERYTATASAAARANGAITLFVSHRFATVRTADLIIVLDGGVVAETGSHDQLMAGGGLYAELFALQARTYR
ncbi:ABC transporter ATP-binding protein [Streptomyces anulatus]|uniref:ABC transporter ATP-binding protein n=1 Tax=Streptomyces anulatus TaxID=1892 RepID=UPI003F4A17B4